MISIPLAFLFKQKIVFCFTTSLFLFVSICFFCLSAPMLGPYTSLIYLMQTFWLVEPNLGVSDFRVWGSWSWCQPSGGWVRPRCSAGWVQVPGPLVFGARSQVTERSGGSYGSWPQVYGSVYPLNYPLYRRHPITGIDKLIGGTGSRGW